MAMKAMFKLSRPSPLFTLWPPGDPPSQAMDGRDAQLYGRRDACRYWGAPDWGLEFRLKAVCAWSAPNRLKAELRTRTGARCNPAEVRGAKDCGRRPGRGPE